MTSRPDDARRAVLRTVGAAAMATAVTRPRAQVPPPGDDRAVPMPPIGTRIELPDLTLLDGTVLRPADTAGQVVVLYWWASWCPFCAVQSPLVDKLWRAHRARGLGVVGLSIDKKPEDAVAYLARRGYTFPSAWVTPAVRQALPKPKGLPITVVLGRDRRVVMGEAGQLFPEDIEAIARFL